MKTLEITAEQYYLIHSLAAECGANNRKEFFDEALWLAGMSAIVGPETIASLMYQGNILLTVKKEPTPVMMPFMILVHAHDYIWESSHSLPDRVMACGIIQHAISRLEELEA